MPPIHTPIKLSDKKAREIRERYADGEDPKVLAKIFKVSTNTIMGVLKFETWGRAGGPRMPTQKDEADPERPS